MIKLVIPNTPPAWPAAGQSSFSVMHCALNTSLSQVGSRQLKNAEYPFTTKSRMIGTQQEKHPCTAPQRSISSTPKASTVGTENTRVDQDAPPMACLDPMSAGRVKEEVVTHSFSNCKMYERSSKRKMADL